MDYFKGIVTEEKESSAFILDKISYTSDQGMATIFNKFFTSVAERLKSTQSNQVSLSDVSDVPNLASVKNFEFNDVSVDFVRKELSSLKVNKSSGLRDIHTPFLKTGADVLAAPLTYIFNLSLHNAIIPRSWKCATVTPLHKDGSVSDPNNFRPISVLPVVMKIFNRAVRSQIYQHLSTNKLLSSHQSGFRPGHSTTTCLLDVSDFILKNMDQGCLTGGLFLDLSKAFDLIDHSILKFKLAHVGILDYALHWFDNYLTGRTQTVCVHGTSSEPMDLNFEVPQGSVLGPLLFLIFINDLPNCVKQSKVVLYADDTALFFVNKDVMTIERVLEEELNSLNNWFHENGVIVNCSKTNATVFGTSQRLAKTSRPCLLYTSPSPRDLSTSRMPSSA